MGGDVAMSIPEVNEVPSSSLLHSIHPVRWCGVEARQVPTCSVVLDFENVGGGLVRGDLLRWSLGNQKFSFPFEGVARSGVGARVVVF